MYKGPLPNPLPDGVRESLARLELRLKDGRYLIAYRHAAQRKADA